MFGHLGCLGLSPRPILCVRARRGYSCLVLLLHPESKMQPKDAQPTSPNSAPSLTVDFTEKHVQTTGQMRLVHKSIKRCQSLLCNFYTRRPKGSGVCYATVIGFVVWSDPPTPPGSPLPPFEIFVLRDPPGFGLRKFCVLRDPPPQCWVLRDPPPQKKFLREPPPLLGNLLGGPDLR